MSSLRVRAQNKVLEKLGTAKRTTNVEFDTAYSGFNTMQQDVISFNRALVGFISSLRGFHAASSVLSTAVLGISRYSSEECPPNVKKFVSEFTDLIQDIDVTQFNQLLSTYESQVLKPSEGWLAQCGELKKRIDTYHESHSNYDHYTRKVVSMREARDKRGGGDKPKDVDKLLRNEHKLVDATTAYREVSQAVVTDLTEFSQSRYTTLGPMIQRLLSFRISYASEMSAASSRFENLVKDFDGIVNLDVGDSYIQRLDELAGQAMTSTNEGEEEGIITDVDLKTIKKAKNFKDFLGRVKSSSSNAANENENNNHSGVGSFNDFVQSESDGQWSNATHHCSISDEAKRDSFDPRAKMKPSSLPPPVPLSAAAEEDPIADEKVVQPATVTYDPVQVVEFDIPQTAGGSRDHSFHSATDSNGMEFNPYEPNDIRVEQECLSVAGVTQDLETHPQSRSVLDDLFGSPSSSAERKVAHNYSGM